MTRALVVDDGKVDRRMAGALLEVRAGMEVLYAGNGREALDLIDRDPPDLVLTDLRMPELDGLQLVEATRERHPSLPVILMTAHGSEEVAAEALRKGAASYVPKRYLARDLSRTVAAILALAAAPELELGAVECLTEARNRFVLDNDLNRVQPLIGYLRRDLARMGLCDETGLLRVGVALNEALSNAIHHGNLEVDSELREDGMDAYMAQLEERSRAAPWQDRRVHVEAEVSRSKAVYVIRDEGNGFDPASLPDPTDAGNLYKASGRGVLLMRTFMNEVRYNEAGNEVTMVKRPDEQA